MKQQQNHIVYCPGQDVLYWDSKEKKYKRASIITAGGGRVKIKQNDTTAWIDAELVRK